MKDRRRALRIYQSELDAIVSEICRFPRTETGGDLFGLWSHGDAPTVFLSSVPGPEAIRQSHHFQQDPATHVALERLVWNQYGLQCVGLWHSHHRLGLEHLSRGDILRTVRYSRRYKRHRFSEILGFFEKDGRVGLRPTVYDNAATARTTPSIIQILPGTSPIRKALAQGPPALQAVLQLGTAQTPPVLRPSGPEVLERAGEEHAPSSAIA